MTSYADKLATLDALAERLTDSERCSVRLALAMILDGIDSAVETVRVHHGRSESAQDAALAGALLSRLPDWPRWERCSDVQALLSYAVDGGPRTPAVDSHSARRDACYRAEGGAL